MAGPISSGGSDERVHITKRTGRRKKNGSGAGERVTWDYVYKIGHGILGYDTRQLGLMTMRQFIGASEGYRLKTTEAWEQARLIAWYAAYERKPMSITDIHIPGNESSQQRSKLKQDNKQEVYSILEKWNK